MKWVLLATVQSREEAIVIGSLLESSGIPFKDVKESIGKAYNITMDGLGETKIYVDRADLDDAKKLIETVENSEING